MSPIKVIAIIIIILILVAATVALIRTAMSPSDPPVDNSPIEIPQTPLNQYETKDCGEKC